MRTRLNIKALICTLIFLIMLSSNSFVVLATDISTTTLVDEFVPDEVVAAASSLEEAEEIASLYNLELKSFAYGIAVFTTPNPETVVRESQSTTLSTLPTLSLNRVYTPYELDEFQVQSELKETSSSVTQSTFVQYHLNELDVETAWETSTGKNVVVAVIDTGVDIDHDELSHAISENSYNSYTQIVGVDAVDDDHGHGTHVSGIIAAAMDDYSGVYGVAPNVELLIIKADRPSDNNFELASLLRAINYAVEKGADVINMSLGSSYTAGALELEQTTIADAVAAGVTIVCAAGNDAYEHAGYPAAYEETIAVSALNQGYAFASSYSNYGPEIDIAAQGTGIYSSTLENDYTSLSGTSMACPVVSGVVALIKSLHSDYTPAQIEETLYATAREAGDLGWDQYYGYGVINAYSAILGADALYTVTYEYNDGDTASISTKVAPSAILIEPNDPEGDSGFLGWTLYQNSTEYFDFTQEITQDITLYATWETVELPKGSVSGVIESYNPQNPVTIELLQGDSVLYSISIDAETGSGLVAQDFMIENVTIGTYDLKITKDVHAIYILTSIIIGETDLDLTQNSDAAIITLCCGDINGDGNINQTDLNVLWLPANYNQTTDTCSDVNCDLNGDGNINQTDLNILWLPSNYNNGTQTTEYVS